MFDSRNLLLIAHVLAAILTIGPVTVAASAFPRHLLAATDGSTAAAVEAHRVTRQYGATSLAVAAIGLALADQTGQLDQGWLQVALGLFVAGAVVLLAVVVPGQRAVLAAADEGVLGASALGRLHATTGLYSLLWTGTLVLMVTKPAW